MAAPATHIVIAKKLYPKYFSGKEQSAYMVGTSFPDIRYLGVIDREKTHYHNLKVETLNEESSFIAGLKLHSLVDEVREKFVKDKGLYTLFPESPFLTQGVKFFEDRVLYGKLTNWDELLIVFNSVFEEELQFGVEEKDVKVWHNLIIKCLSSQPHDDTLTQFVSDIGKPGEMATEILRVVNGVKDKAQATEIVNEFYNNFESLI